MPQDVAAVLAAAFAGPPALPYAAEFRYLVQQHLTELVQDLPSLHIKTRDYTHIDGRTVHLLLAEGTVPMWYQSVKYNIPVAIWLPERYPLAGPLAYVVPTPDMVIKPRHTFVDASGLVHTPYISQWQYPSSNLRELAQDMSMHFASDPPLFSKPKNWNQVSAAAAAQQPHAGYPGLANGGSVRPPGVGAGSAAAAAAAAADVVHCHNPIISGDSYMSPGSKPPASSSQQPSLADAAGASGGFESVWNRVMNANLQEPPQPLQPVPAKPPQPPRENPSAKLAAAFRSAAQATLNKRLHASLSALAQQAAAQGDEQLQLQATLRQRGLQLQSEVAALQAERVALDKLSQDLAASNEQLDRWLADNEHLAKAAEDPSQLDPDAVITAADPLSQQALEVQAQDLALEDALYALDKALNSNSVEPDVYLRQVRAISRRQFYTRSLGNKVAVAQKSAPPPQPQPVLPSSVPRSLSMGRAVVLPQGDSWANAGIMASRFPPT